MTTHVSGCPARRHVQPRGVTPGPPRVQSKLLAPGVSLAVPSTHAHGRILSFFLPSNCLGAEQLAAHESHDPGEGPLWDVMVLDEGHKLKVGCCVAWAVAGRGARACSEGQ